MKIQLQDSEKLAQAIVDTIREITAAHEQRIEAAVVYDLANRIQEFVRAQYEPACNCC